VPFPANIKALSLIALRPGLYARIRGPRARNKRPESSVDFG
jgi:hypothetical protein